MKSAKPRNSNPPTGPDHVNRVRLVMKEDDLAWWETWWFWIVLIVMVLAVVTAWAVPGTMDAGVSNSGKGKAVIQEN